MSTIGEIENLILLWNVLRGALQAADTCVSLVLLCIKNACGLLEKVNHFKM